MLTKNFWALFTGFIGKIQGSSKTVAMKKVDGSNYSETVFSSSSKPYTMLGAIAIPLSDTRYGTFHGTWYGKGRTPATWDDYTLADPITDSSVIGTAGTEALVNNVSTDHVEISVPHSVTNQTDNPITIGEIGCFGQAYSGGSAILLDRTVLEEPITIPPRGTVRFEYVIKFPYGT